jgi:predicted ATP-dependent protease
MVFKLIPNEVLYNIRLPQIRVEELSCDIPQYSDVLKKIKSAIDIQGDGYNIFLIDSCCRSKIDTIQEYIDDILKYRDKPKDICYVTKEDERSPIPLKVSNGMGNRLKEITKSIRNEYEHGIFKFYNNFSSKEKDELIEDIELRRNDMVAHLVEMSKEEGFEVTATTSGFTFMPLNNDSLMSEKDYDALSSEEKSMIIKKVNELKIKAQDILEEIKKDEEDGVNAIKDVYRQYFLSNFKNLKEKYFSELRDENEALSFIKYVCENIENEAVNLYSLHYEDDEEKISEIINKFDVNVIVDNSKNKYPRVIFEEDPSVQNLIGTIEYENHNGTYSADLNLICAGSLLKANEGCLIIKASDLFNNQVSYYYLKKALSTKKIKFDYNRNYMDLISISGLKPEPVKIDTKVILIGDYNIYDLLYNNDVEFSSIFKIKSEFNQIVDNTKENVSLLIKTIMGIVNKNKLNPLTDGAIKEIIKSLSRKACNREKFLYEYEQIDKIIMCANNKALEEGRKKIESKDIISVVYEKDPIQDDILENYRKDKVICNTKDNIVGSINALSVIDLGYISFGRPMRLTCVCYKGSGNIYDVHRESHLSGNIHGKSIGILRGYLNRTFGGYSGIPVDMQVSFEQLYGKLEGDSASVAEIVVILSALSNIEINQNLAVTGSINQFGEVQAIGGVNEKIEGFFNVCKSKGEVKDHGVLIPYSNKDELVLNSEVESAIKKGDFTIYTMKTVDDAIDTLMGTDKLKSPDIMELINKELKKYAMKGK